MPINDFKIGPESLQKWVNEVKNKTQPSIIPDAVIITLMGIGVVSLSIHEFPIKPVAFKGRYFKRVNNANHQLSVSEIANLNLQSLQISWDAYIAHDKTIEDLDFQKVKEFLEKVNTSGRFVLKGNMLENLDKLKLIRGESITNAAFLLFGKESIGYNIHLGRFKTPSYIIDDKMFNGSLFEMVEEVMRYIISQIKVAFEIKGMPTQRTEIFEYPLPALRELVLNTLIHRDYLSPVDVQIRIFDHEITFYNPGKLFGDLTVNDLKRDNYQAFARNKLIAEAFYLTGDIEKYGSGFLRIRKEIKVYSTMKMNFDEIPNGFLISLNYERQKIDTVESIEGVNGGVNELLELVISHPGNRGSFFEKRMNVPLKSIERWFKTLKQANKIEFIGASKTGGYYVKEEINEGVNEGVNELLELIEFYPGSRIPFFVAQMNTPIRTIERWLQILRQANKIEFVGVPKTGGYHVKLD